MMMIPVIWSDTSKDIYANLISYLVERFGTDAALKVDDAVESLIENISNNKYLCPKSNLDINRRNAKNKIILYNSLIMKSLMILIINSC